MKIKALLYCCREKNKGDRLVRDEHYGKPFWLYGAITPNFESLNGKIACECEVDTEEIVYDTLFNNYATWELGYTQILNRSKIKEKELFKYLGKENKEKKFFKRYIKNCGYALHLSNVKEKVMELSSCYSQSQVDKLNVEEYFYQIKGIEKAPQNMQWVYILNHEDKLEKRLLISVRPEWLCLILNKQKDIEVRRKVLKGMVE